MEKTWLEQPRLCSVWVHRTVSGAPGWRLVNCLLSGLIGGVRLKITGQSGEPTVGRANGRPRNPRVTRGRANGLMGAPDCPVRQWLQTVNGWLRQNRKEICTGQCPMVQSTEGKICLPRLLSTTLSCLGTIKGTPRHMKEYTKHTLSILTPTLRTRLTLLVI
jgi:hypothetical protein